MNLAECWVELLAASMESPSGKNLAECWVEYLDAKQVVCLVDQLVGLTVAPLAVNSVVV